MALSKKGVCQAPKRPNLCKLYRASWLFTCDLNYDH